MVLDAAGSVGSVETLEYFIFFFIRDADAVIRNGQGKGFRFFRGIRRQGQGNASAGGRIADSIVQEYGDYLA